MPCSYDAATCCKDAFEIHPSYLQDTTARDGAANFADRGLQLTRMSRALKLWVSLQYFGVDAFAAAIDRRWTSPSTPSE